MSLLTYKNYHGSVEYSAEDNILYGEVLGLKKASISYEGTSLAELQKDFQDGVDHYIQSCKDDNIVPEKPSQTEIKLAFEKQLKQALA